MRITKIDRWIAGALIFAMTCFALAVVVGLSAGVIALLW